MIGVTVLIFVFLVLVLRLTDMGFEHNAPVLRLFLRLLAFAGGAQNEN
jgi:hypothetical protein